jgi:hypothetical protein
MKFAKAELGGSKSRPYAFSMKSWMVFAALGLGIVSVAGAADRILVEASLPFDMTKDAICFKNGDPGLAKTGIPILGRLGMNTGVCQGIAGISAAFRENVEFVPAAPPAPANEIDTLVDRAVRANREQSREKITITGYSSLVDLCNANRMKFLRKSVWMNLDILVADILEHYPQFRLLKKNPISKHPNSEQLRHELADHLADALSELREGHYPLILYFSHVVTARAYREVQAEDGSRRIELEVYDSNHLEATRVLTFKRAADGLPATSNWMIWTLHTHPVGGLDINALR